MLLRRRRLLLLLCIQVSRARTNHDTADYSFINAYLNHFMFISLFHQFATIVGILSPLRHCHFSIFLLKIIAFSRFAQHAPRAPSRIGSVHHFDVFLLFLFIFIDFMSGIATEHQLKIIIIIILLQLILLNNNVNGS